MTLHKLTATELLALMTSKQASAVEVLEAHLHRIEELNPLVNAVVSIDEDSAYSSAREADKAMAAGRIRGPLHGLPISFKDTALTAGMKTTFGSRRYQNFIPDHNTLHVDRIVRAGAVRIGKTNVPEYAAGSNTFNPVFGATRNPFDARMSVGGSSGGAAAALAAGFQPIADGSDMGGSLRNPAAFCNVVGFRPTPGRVPNAGSNLFSPLTVNGPMARTVGDVSLLLGVMGLPHSMDPNSDRRGFASGESGREGIAGLRVAVAPTLGGLVPVETEILATVDRQARLLESLGAIVEPACPDLTEAESVFRVLRAAEFQAELGPELDARPGTFNDFLARNIREGRNLSAADVMRAYEGLSRLMRGATEFFRDYDLLLAPTTQLSPFPVEIPYPTEVNGQTMPDYLGWMSACFLLTPLGIPVISIPGGFTRSGLPIGVQLAAAPAADAFLLKAAQTIEQANDLPIGLADRTRCE